MPFPLLSVIMVAVMISVIIWYRTVHGPRLTEYYHLIDPRITHEPDVMVLEVAGRGPTHDVARHCFSTLFKVYYKMRGVPKGPRMPLPRARWQFETANDTDSFGRIAIPIPESVTRLPSIEPPQNMIIQITRWAYGDVAEILHIGPYETEQPAVVRLKQYIISNGYEIAGDHEELYLKGPGMFGNGNPSKYHTIIRYRIHKKAV